jgi:hypothetical protein
MIEGNVYSKKEIIIATIISLVILALCVGSIVATILVASAPATPAPTLPSSISKPLTTDDLINTLAATVVGQGAVPASQFSADVQYVLDTSAIPCLIVLILILGSIVGLDYYNHKKGKLP